MWQLEILFLSWSLWRQWPVISSWQTQPWVSFINPLINKRKVLVVCRNQFQQQKQRQTLPVPTNISNFSALRSTPGVSNSVSYAGHILTKKELAGRIRRKNVSARLYTTKNSSFSNNLSNINDVAGRTNTSGRPHAACGPRVWDPCSTLCASEMSMNTLASKV